VQDGQWVIDDSGELLASGSYGLLRLLPRGTYQGNLIADLVRNLGFVGIKVRLGRVSITLRNSVVSSTALASALYWLADHQPKHIIVDFSVDKRPAEIFTTAASAIARLVKITGSAALQSRFSEQSIDVDAVPAHRELAQLHSVWANQGRTNTDYLVDFADKRLACRYAVVVARGDDLLFAQIGNGLQVPVPDWRQKAIGQPVCRQPDTDYWAWVAAQQRIVLAQSRPSLAKINTEIYWPSFGWARRNYIRMLLPCTTAKHEAYLFSASVALDDTVGADLPI
jgi:hypothetical protein